jgi:hypothetical protein
MTETGVDHWRDWGAIVFASCTPREKSYEEESEENGAFTQAIIEALLTPRADTPRAGTGKMDGYLSLDELQLYVRKRVPEMTEGKQHPAMKMPLDVADFDIAKLPAP